MIKKTCFKCSRRLVISEFYKHSKMADGHLNKCKKCTRSDVNLNRAENLEYYQAYDRERAELAHRKQMRDEYAKTPAGKAATAKAHSKYATSNKHKINAANKVRRAIAKGVLMPLPCFVCGASAQAHHPAYDLPLAVSWLCQYHHLLLHKEHRELLRINKL